MDGHILEGKFRSHQTILDLVGDVVALADGDGAADADMKIGNVGEAAFSNPALLGTKNPGDGAGGLKDGLLGLA